jgi:hypothetical protein
MGDLPKAELDQVLKAIKVIKWSRNADPDVRELANGRKSRMACVAGPLLAVLCELGSVATAALIPNKPVAGLASP